MAKGAKDDECSAGSVRMRTPRLYHSTALLLPDGTVLTAGTDRILNRETESPDRTELECFSPPYCSRARVR
jgi:hypothetical protein